MPNVSYIWRPPLLKFDRHYVRVFFGITICVDVCFYLPFLGLLYLDFDTVLVAKETRLTRPIPDPTDPGAGYVIPHEVVVFGNHMLIAFVSARSLSPDAGTQHFCIEEHARALHEHVLIRLQISLNRISTQLAN